MRVANNKNNSKKNRKLAKKAVVSLKQAIRCYENKETKSNALDAIEEMSDNCMNIVDALT